MKIVHQGKTEEDSIVEFEDAFEAAFEPEEAERRRAAAMEAHADSDYLQTFACESPNGPSK